MSDGPQRLRVGARAHIFAVCLPGLQTEARKHGYALTVHGSMMTDLDLVACPWTPEAVTPRELIEVLRTFVGGFILDERIVGFQPEKKPHGRLAWSIYLEDKPGGPYLDISVMPRRRSK